VLGDIPENMSITIDFDLPFRLTAMAGSVICCHDGCGGLKSIEVKCVKKLDRIAAEV